MEKLLIIGAGIGQIYLIKKAKSLGLHVTVATLPGDLPGIELADDVIYCDIYDRDQLAQEAKNKGITAVISDQNDLMMPTVAYVAEKLGIPGNTFDQVMAYCSKIQYRDNCQLIGNPGPKHIAVNSEDFDFASFTVPFPWIVKPADSQSSVGVRKVENMEELKEALSFALSKSPTHQAIVEEFFVGKEIVCEGFIEDGKYRLLSFADRKYFDLENLAIPSQTVFPSLVKQELLEKIVLFETKMAEYIHPSFAITHSEYLVNEETNEIRVVESALRGGGVFISSHLIPLATNIDINSLLLSKALGHECNVEEVFEKREDKASGYICFYLPEGIVQSVTGIEELNQLDFVKMVNMDAVNIGQKTEKMLHKGLRYGPILVSGKDRSELEENIRTVQETLQINVETPSGEVKGIIWS